MNLASLHTSDKPVSATNAFKGEIGSATAIQLQKSAVLKEHVTKTPAWLICIDGLVTYEDETGQKIELSTGDYVHIVVNVKHWLVAAKHSQLILFK